MTRPPCESFIPGKVYPLRCERCGWIKGKHRLPKRAICEATGKIRHATRAGAAKRLNRLVTQPVAGKDPHTLMVYRCDACRDWHVGHGSGGDDDVATSKPRADTEATR